MTAPDIARIRALAQACDPALGPMAPVLLSKQNVLALCDMAELWAGRLVEEARNSEAKGVSAK